VDRLRGLINEFEDLASLLRAALRCAHRISRPLASNEYVQRRGGEAMWNLSRDETSGPRKRASDRDFDVKGGTLPRSEALDFADRYLDPGRARAAYVYITGCV